MTKRTTKTSLPFTKMSGAGNDFIIIDFRERQNELDRPAFVKGVCRRSQGVGADGVVFIEKSQLPGVAFKWDFYNADGSVAEMCGNAARCVSRFATENEITGENLKFETKVGVISARVLRGHIVEVDLPEPKIVERDLEILVGEHIKIKVMVINSGVPHVVKENNDWDDEYLHDMGAYLRKSDFFKKYGGANATFYEVTGPSSLHSATYERGVEAVTMACGTGAVAAAIAALFKQQVRSPVDVKVPGGQLEVKKTVEGVTLIGEARFICEGFIFAEATQ